MVLFGWKKDNSMYEFDKLKDEEIVVVSENAILKVDSEDKEITVIVTNKRILLFGEDRFNYQESLRVSKGTDYLPKRVLLFSAYVSDIRLIEEDYDKYILSDGNYFYLKDNSIKKFFKSFI